MSAALPKVRQATAEDGELVRHLRLQALSEAAEDFDSTHADALGWREEDWKQWIERSALFLLELQGGCGGLARLCANREDPSSWFVGSFWVDPALRGKAAAPALMAALLAEAERQGLGAAWLHVRKSNGRAVRFYERCGFRGTGVEIARERDNVVEVEMKRAAVRYVKGDATEPVGEGPKILCHVCNDVGGWGIGFVLAVSRRWAEPEAAYATAHTRGEIALGDVEFVKVEPDLWVANMVAQHDVVASPDGPPIRYAALELCLASVADRARRLHASIHMPRIGCGLAGGEWARVEPLLRRHLIEAALEVVVYDIA